MRFTSAWASFFQLTRQATAHAVRSYFQLSGRPDKSNTRVMLDVSFGYATRARWSALFVGAIVTAAVTTALVDSAPHLAERGVEYSTGASEWRTVTFSDGTVATLGPSTLLRVRFEKERRFVALRRGEAVYRVAHEPARPFVVRTQYAEIKALGTQFAVRYLAAQAAAITVVDGRVAVQRIEGASVPVVLIAGQQVVASALGTTAPANIDATSELTRMHLFLDLDRVTLAEVVQKFNAGNEVQIDLRDPELAARRIAGRMRIDAPEDFVNWLESQPGLEIRAIRESPTRIRLVRMQTNAADRSRQ